MKNTGMNRKVDDLGRIVLPSELRRSMGLKEGSSVDIMVEADRIILTARKDACVFCGTKNDLKEFRSEMICAGCIGELSGNQVGSAWEPFAEA